MGANPILATAAALPTAPGEAVHWGKAYGCAPALALSEIRSLANELCVVIAPTVAAAESLEAQLQFFSGEDSGVMLLPDPETLPYDSFSPHQDLISRRLSALSKLAFQQLHTLIIAVPTLFYRLPPKKYLRASSISLRKGQLLVPGDLRAQLDGSGYQRVAQVEEHGEYAVRGSLMDVFPMGSEAPVRLDFFDDELESIRRFDPDTQLTDSHLDSLETLPAREFPVTDEAIRNFRQRFRSRFEGNPAESLIYREVSEHRLPGGVENYLPLFFDDTATIWEYLPDDALVVCIDEPDTAIENSWEQITQRFEQYQADRDRPVLKPEELFCAATDHFEGIRKHRRIILQPHKMPDAGDSRNSVNLDADAAPRVLISSHAEEPAQRLFEFIDEFQGRILFAAESAGRREMLSDLLNSRKVDVRPVASWHEFLTTRSPVTITVAPLDHGLVIGQPQIGIVAEQEMFGDKPARRRRRSARDPETILNDLTDLRRGSPVVHENYGVGRYTGLSRLSIDGVLTEFLSLEYAGGDLLHVPVSSLHLVSRYTGASPEHAPLHRLGTDQWARIRHRAAEKIRDVAAELLDLYAQRASRTGVASRLDMLEYEKFAAAFPFELTEDQATAVDQSLDDLTSAKTMDRLICGDVGFGKTEVALRAAFVAVSDGRQVALLAPTTLLAQQHFATFSDRFADWPVNVEVLSRFRTARETSSVLNGIESGTVDIVIGTHKLLQRDVEFKDLGLIIIDEEHRFGVRQKEQLKSLRSEVDVLTLTATPIPRTLNMSLGGLRDLSLITTPPDTRLSIKTFVTGWNDAVIREALQRELKRGGQVYFVHNRIEDIDRIAQKVAELVPEAGIRVAHGQLRERELEQIMLDFYHRQFHVLVCTSIIESGLDVPTANTIIIDRADRFGLAQLHQLRGRVGRSHHKAYAYLIAPPKEAMTADAAKRLEAIESMEDLGAGFVLATHDLEIRGAGELLGEEQTGQIQEIGFSLYSDLLARAVESIRDGDIPELEETAGHGPEVNLHLPALLPEDYLPDVHLRLIHYKRIATADSDEALQGLQIELIDRFGLLPPAAKNLFRTALIKLRASQIGIRKIDAYGSGGVIEFDPTPRIDPRFLVELIQSDDNAFSFDRKQRLKFAAPMEDEQMRFKTVEDVIDMLSSNTLEVELPAKSA